MPPCTTCNRTGNCTHPETMSATSPTRPKVLFVVTSHDQLGGTDRKTWWYLVDASSHPTMGKRLTYLSPKEHTPTKSSFHTRMLYGRVPKAAVPHSTLCPSKSPRSMPSPIRSSNEMRIHGE